MSARVAWLPFLALVLAGGVSGDAAPAPKDEAAAIRFLRILTPENRINDWPLGEGKYLPLDAAEFERLAAIGESHTSKTPAVAAISARYEARLADDQLIGEAAMDVILAGSEPALLSFEPCNLAIRSTNWTGTPSQQSETAGGVALGLGSDGKQELMVDHSGRLSFEWSLDGRRDPGDIVSFSLEIPDSPANQLFLELPGRFAPVIDRGMIVGSDPSGEHSRRWRIELGGNHRLRLRVVPVGETGRRPQLALLREARTYDVSYRGLEVSAQWNLQVHNEPLQQVTVLLDPELQLASARFGDVSIPWSASSTPDGRGTRVMLSLPEPIRDAERVIRLGAFSRTVLDRPWRLPRIRAEGLFWQEGNLTVLIPGPLVAQRIKPYGCEQTGTGPLSSPRTGESAQFQAFAPDATVEVLLSRHPVAVRMLGAAAIELGGQEATARVAVDLQTTEEAHPEIAVDAAKQWIVDAVESVPAGAVADWTVEPGKDGSHALTIRLADALLPARPVGLVISARRPFSPPLQKLDADDLWPMRFRDITDSRQLVSVRPVGAYAIKLAGAERLSRLRADGLTPAERGLFAEPPGDLLFECDARAKGLEVSLIGQKARYAGAIQVDAAVGNRLLHENFLLRCVPESGQVDRVIVQFSPRRDTTLHWSLVGEDDRQFSARQWSPEEQKATGRDASLETWEVVLRRPRTAPFELSATRDTPMQGRGRELLSLAALPDADAQRGTLVVRNLAPRAIYIDNRRLQPILPSPTPPGRSETIRGVFRYDPGRDLAEGAGATVRILNATERDSPRAWVWRCRLQSWYQNDGMARHLAVYDLQNDGCRSLRLVLPHVGGIELRGVWVDGAPVETQVAAMDEERRLAVDLPPGRKFPSVAIQWTASGPRMGIVGWLAPTLLQPDLPVLARYWTAWLPPGYGALGPSLVSPSIGGGEPTWSRRLFGPLGRAAGAEPFNPFSANNWIEPFVDLRDAPKAAMGVDRVSASRKVSMRQPAGLAALWPSDSSTPSQPADSRGWTAVRVELSGDVPVTVEFVHRTSMQLLGAVVLLLTAAFGCWKLQFRPVLLTSVLGAFGVAALVLPAAYLPIASGGVLGAIFCWLWQWIRPQAPRPAFDGPPSGSGVGSSPDKAISTTVPRLATVLMVLSSSFCGGVAQGAGPANKTNRPPESLAASSPLYRVFVPIDANQKPVGANVYVPEPLYQELHRRAAAATEKPHGWLILAATYRGKLVPETVSGRLAVETLRVQFDLRVFGHGARLRIPLRSEGANLLPSSAMIDGQPIEPEWEPNGAMLAFPVSEPGEHRLELALRPVMRNTAGQVGFDVLIPRVAESRFELAVPEGAPAVDVPSACGASRMEKDPPRLLVDLGPADRLTVRWQEGLGANGAGPAVDVEQFEWLRVQPGSVAIAAKFKLHVLEGQVQQFQLAIDPRLRLLPLPGEDPPTVQAGPETGQFRLVTLRWPHPVPDQVVLDATFLLSGALGVGNIRLPRIEVLDARSTQRWLAVSVDPALDREEQQTQQLEAVAASDFLRAWGATNPKPQAAYRLPAGETDWTLSTRPHEPRTTADQMLTLRVDEDHVDAVFEADLSTTSGYLFQHRLTAPKGLKIESVSLLEEGAERASRWSQDADGTVTVFLNAPVSGRQKLTLRGQVPIHLGEEWFIPPVQLERCELRWATVRLFRDPGVLLTIRGGRQGAGEEGPGDAVAPDTCRFVEAFLWDTAQPPSVAVMAQPNRPTVRAEQSVWPAWNGSNWTVRTDCRVSVRNGVVDEIRIRTPASWNGPYEANPPGHVRVSQAPGEERQLIYWPQAAIADNFRLTIDGPMEVGRGEHPGVPDIALLRVDELERWFLLPDRAQGRDIHWQTRGLAPSSWPSDVALSPAPGVSAYKVSGEPLQAVLAAAQTPSGPSFVRLADIALAWRTDGSYCGAAEFDLEPGGAGQCPLHLPESCELVQISVEGMPVTPKAIGDGDWQFALASQRLPQRVEVIFRGKVSDGTAGRRDFAAPMLGELPVRQTLWTVFGPHSWMPVETHEASASSSWKLELARLKSAAASLESAATTSANDDQTDAPSWFQSWSRRRIVSRAALESDLRNDRDATADEVSAAKREADATDQQNRELAQRLGTVDILAQLSAGGLADDSPRDILRDSTETGHSVVGRAFDGPASSLMLDYQQRGRDGLASPLAAAGALGLLLALAIGSSLRGRLADWLRRWPHAPVAVLGLAWWLWLSPSILGLGIVLLSALAAAYSALAFNTKSCQKSRA